MSDKRTQHQRRQRQFTGSNKLKKDSQGHLIDMIIEDDSEQNKD